LPGLILTLSLTHSTEQKQRAACAGRCSTSQRSPVHGVGGSGVSVGGTGVPVGTAVAVGVLVAVGGSGVSVGTAVSVGVAVASGVGVGGAEVLVGVAVGGTDVGVGVAGARAKLITS
jgi:hypothetical protein